MKNILFGLIFLALTACATSKNEDAPAPSPTVNSDFTLVSLPHATLFYYMPTTVVTGPIPWMWYAPAFANGFVPEFYRDGMRNAGNAVVGCDAGETFGSPFARQAYLECWEWLKSNGFETSGIFLAQSRGGLFTYSFLLEHPTAAKAVAGIYPLLSYDDYIGPTGYANSWGISLADFNSIRSQSEPLANASSFNIPIFHIHGDADLTVHLSYDQQFVAAAPNASVEIIPGGGHDFYPVATSFFNNQNLLNFMLAQ